MKDYAQITQQTVKFQHCSLGIPRIRNNYKNNKKKCRSLENMEKFAYNKSLTNFKDTDYTNNNK